MLGRGGCQSDPTVVVPSAIPQLWSPDTELAVRLLMSLGLRAGSGQQTRSDIACRRFSRVVSNPIVVRQPVLLQTRASCGCSCSYQAASHVCKQCDTAAIVAGKAQRLRLADPPYPRLDSSETSLPCITSHFERSLPVQALSRLARMLAQSIHYQHCVATAEFLALCARRRKKLVFVANVASSASRHRGQCLCACSLQSART